MTQSPRSRRHPIHVSQQHTCEVIRERLQPVPVRPPSSTRRPKVLGKPQRRELTAHQPTTHMTTARRPTLRLARLHLGRERADPPLPPQRRVVHAHPVAPPPLDDHTSLLSSSHSLHSVALNFRCPPIICDGIPSRTRNSTQRVENPKCAAIWRFDSHGSDPGRSGTRISRPTRPPPNRHVHRRRVLLAPQMRHHLTRQLVRSVVLRPQATEIDRPAAGRPDARSHASSAGTQ